MKRGLAAFLLVCGIAVLPGAAVARGREAQRHAPEAADHQAAGTRLHHMEQLRRKHDLRRIYHDRRPRRHMRSL